MDDKKKITVYVDNILIPEDVGFHSQTFSTSSSIVTINTCVIVNKPKPCDRTFAILGFCSPG